MKIPIKLPLSNEESFLAKEILALVVSQLFPQVKLLGGGVNSLGFYYDFIFDQSLYEGMSELIDVHMLRFIKEGHLVRSISMMRENAQTLFEYRNAPFLAERVVEDPSNIVDLVQIGDFYGLCPAISLTETQSVGYVKLLDNFELSQLFGQDSVRITRFIGTCQASARELKGFVKNYESFLKKKDHRVLGPKLNLFSFSESTGELGFVWHPKGVELQKILIQCLKSFSDDECFEISTPSVVLEDFLGVDLDALESFEFEGSEYRLRSSPLRQHLEFLQRSHKTIGGWSIKVSEKSTFYSYVPEPHRWGLFSQSVYLGEQTTICCLKEQVVSELISSLHFIEQIITMFGFEAQWVLVVSRQKTPKARLEHQAVDWLKQAMQAKSRIYPCLGEMQEVAEIEGPGFELRVRDVLGREWPISFLGLVHPSANFSLVDQSSEKAFVITRQIWKSLDRLIALLIERYEGDFPLWLAPEQVRVIVIGEANHHYGQQVCKRLRSAGLRVRIDLRQLKLGEKVHEAEKEQVPYLILVGEQERVRQQVSVRTTEKNHQGQSIDLETFLTRIISKSSCPGFPEE